MSWFSKKSKGGDDLENNVPMQNLPRPSTETERINGFMASKNPDRSERIYEDLKDGAITCSICLEAVCPERAPTVAMWHCRDCTTIFHLHCVDKWSRGNRYISGINQALGLGVWKCPNCQSGVLDHPKSMCWGNHKAANDPDVSIHRQNACGDPCGKTFRCDHDMEKVCNKTCHPGQCDVACDATCSGIPVKTPAELAAWGRMRQRIQKREKGSMDTILFLFALITIFEVLVTFFLRQHIRWYSRPDNLLFVWVPMTFVLTALFKSVGDFLSYAFNLDSRPRTHTNDFTQCLGCVVLCLIGGFMWLWPLAGFIGGVDWAWNAQMKDSCNGMQTRVNMDTIWENVYRRTEFVLPTQQFNFVNAGDPDTRQSTFYLAPHTATSTEAFNYYYRFAGGSSQPPYVAVDVDIDHQMWRYVHLSRNDTQNSWLAHDSHSLIDDKYFPLAPNFLPYNTTIISVGSFNNVTHSPPSSRSLDLKINNSTLLIPSFYSFIHDCHAEPFLRAFKYEYSGQERDRLMHKEWTSKNDEREVMRTASFGHGRQRLDMCLRDKTEIVVEGYKETPEWLVVFAVVASYRQRAFDTELRTFQCQEY